jgi:hypothetical protein
VLKSVLEMILVGKIVTLENKISKIRYNQIIKISAAKTQRNLNVGAKIRLV